VAVVKVHYDTIQIMLLFSIGVALLPIGLVSVSGYTLYLLKLKHKYFRAHLLIIRQLF
jgi:hypothetical protein